MYSHAPRAAAVSKTDPLSVLSHSQTECCANAMHKSVAGLPALTLLVQPLSPKPYPCAHAVSCPEAQSPHVLPGTAARTASSITTGAAMAPTPTSPHASVLLTYADAPRLLPMHLHLLHTRTLACSCNALCSSSQGLMNVYELGHNVGVCHGLKCGCDHCHNLILQ